MIDQQAVRREYLIEIARRLRTPQGGDIAARALAVIDKWVSNGNIHPRYVEQWRRILAQGPEAVEEVARSTTDQAGELRHCMPFAGILTNRERQQLRARH